MKRSSKQIGFTLLEVMVALMITAMIMTVTYTAFRQLVRADERATRREAQLEHWLHLARLLQRDAAYLQPGRGAEFELAAEQLSARYRGQVLPTMALGTEVKLRYHWEKASDGDASGVTWRREVLSAGSDSPIPWLQTAIDGELHAVTYELLVGADWIKPEDFVQGSVRALRWTFDWTEIGPWQLVLAVQ